MFTKLVYTWKCLLVGMNNRKDASTTTWAHQNSGEQGLVGLGAEGRQRNGQRIRHEGARDVAVGRRFEGEREELGRDDEGDHRQDQQAGAIQRQAVRAIDQSALEEVHEDEQDAEGDEVLDRDRERP